MLHTNKMIVKKQQKNSTLVNLLLETQCASQNLHKLPNVLEPAVQRHRRHPQHVRLPLVAHDAVLLECLGNVVQEALPQEDTQLRAALGGVSRGDDLEEGLGGVGLGVDLVQQVLCVGSQDEGLGPEIAHARLVEDGQGGGDAGQVQGGRVGHLVSRGAGGGHKGVGHVEADALVAAVPAGQTRAVGRALRVVDKVNLAVALVDKGSGGGSGPGVDVLVGAPAGKVDVPVVQLELDVARRVGEIPADDDASLLGVGGDARDVEQLARPVLDARQQDQGGRVGVGVDSGEHLFRGDQIVVIRLNLDHALLRIQSVPHNLALDGVVVAGEGLPLQDDLVPLAVGLVEAGHHHVQVDRQRAHVDNLAGRGSHEVGRLVGAVLGHVLPLHQRRLVHVGEVAVDAHRRPRLQLGVDIVADGLGLRAQRVSDKVDALLSLSAIDTVGAVGGALGFTCGK